ncbi:MAG: triple tyrosine motif-containing protein, partial [Bacteroidales bacterium]
MKRLPGYRYFLFFFLIFLVFQTSGQERGLLFSDFYSPTDYNAGTQNWAIVQDNRGLMYFGNSNCILEYDGVSWRQIYVTNQSAVRSLAIDSNNNIYAGAYNEFGVLTPDIHGQLQYQTLTHLIDKKHSDFGDVWNVYCINDEVFFLTEKYLFRLKNNKIDYWEKTAERFYLSFKANNKIYVLELGKGLMVFENNSLKLIEKGEYFSNKKIHAIIPFENNLLIGTRANGLYLYEDNRSSVKITPISQISGQAALLNQYFIDNILYHGIKVSGHLFALSSINGTVLTIDKQWNIIDVISNESTGLISPTHYLYFDQNQSLWMALANGICKVEIYSPFRYWTDELGLVGTISDVASLDNYTYVATGSGIYYAKNKNKQDPFSVSQFHPVKGTFEQSWWFLYFFIPDHHFENPEENIFQKLSTLKSPSSDETLLLIATSRGLFQIKENKSKKISNYQLVLKPHQYSKDPSKLFLGLNDGIALLDYSNGQWTDLGKQFDIKEQIRDIHEDSLGNLWASASYKGLYQIQNPLNQNNKKHKITLHSSEKGLPSVKAISIGRHQNKLYFVSDNNFYKYNVAADSFLIAKDFFHTDEDTTGEESSSDTISWYKVYDKMISNFYVTTFSDSVVWFGTTEGTFRYNNIFNKDYYKFAPPIIRNVNIKDSVLYFGTNFSHQKKQKDTVLQKHLINTSTKTDIGTVLSYGNNSLTFEFASPFYDEESKNKYQYILEGYDKSWSDWTSETKKEYTNLREGNYIFKVKSKNLYDIESETASFHFKILPPWYRSFAAILAYIILGILIIIGIVRLYTYRLIREKDKLEKIVIQRTQEILMQKEEILVQAEHLKDANERISAKNTEL